MLWIVTQYILYFLHRHSGIVSFFCKLIDFSLMTGANIKFIQ